MSILTLRGRQFQYYSLAVYGEVTVRILYVSDLLSLFYLYIDTRREINTDAYLAYIRIIREDLTVIHPQYTEDMVMVFKTRCFYYFFIRKCEVAVYLNITDPEHRMKGKHEYYRQDSDSCKSEHGLLECQRKTVKECPVLQGRKILSFLPPLHSLLKLLLFFRCGVDLFLFLLVRLRENVFRGL